MSVLHCTALNIVLNIRVTVTNYQNIQYKMYISNGEIWLAVYIVQQFINNVQQFKETLLICSWFQDEQTELDQAIATSTSDWYQGGVLFPHPFHPTSHAFPPTSRPLTSHLQPPLSHPTAPPCTPPFLYNLHQCVSSEFGGHHCNL
jgi:hypothetical protein